MASVGGPARAHDRHIRRRPFSSLMKRLANLKNSHTDPSSSGSIRLSHDTTTRFKRNQDQRNGPYLQLDPEQDHNGRLSSSIGPRESKARALGTSASHSKHSFSAFQDGQGQPKSRAPTLATTAETTVSGAGTNTTAGGRTEGDRDSTFSSSHSVRSVTTTLTTMQSTAPVHAQPPAVTAAAGTTNHHHQQPPQNQSPFTSQPAPAIPAHLALTGPHPTYHAATANNILTDNASVMTLASSSKRGRRRNSVDTNASVKALAPASMFGGSRESLPLSVLSGTVINPGGFADSSSIRGDTASLTGGYYPPRTGSVLNAERASLISASGVMAPTHASERNSYIGASKLAGDAGSVRSGLLGHFGAGAGVGGERQERIPLHGRNDSLGAISIGASSLLREREMVTAPASPMAV